MRGDRKPIITGFPDAKLQFFYILTIFSGLKIFVNQKNSLILRLERGHISFRALLVQARKTTMASNDTQKTGTNAVENLNEHLTQAGMKVQEHKKIILWVILGIILAGAFVIGYFFIYQNPRIEKSWDEYAKVEMQAMGNDSIAQAGYKKLVDKYGSTGAGPTAALQMGLTLYQQGKYEDALRYLKKADVGEPVLKASTTRTIGDCYVNLKKYDSAIEWFDKAISQADGNPQLVPVIMMKKANIYEEQKKYQQALDTYENIKEDYPEFNYGLGMDAYIARAKARLGK